jgi:organic hydroperoxide reductase OsmC/OhrA
VRPAIVGGAPPEFDGDEAVWSPEHLLLGAVGLCIETTFEAFAKRAALPVLAWTAHVDGTLDRTASGLAFTRIVAHVDVTVEPEVVERAHAIMERTKRSCIVSASLAVPVEVDARIAAAPEAAA